MAEKCRADYLQLFKIAHDFEDQCDAVRDIRRMLLTAVEELRNGAWVGKGAKRFFNEMDGVVFPSMHRLQFALCHAAKVTRQIAEVWQKAEQDSAECLEFYRLS